MLLVKTGRKYMNLDANFSISILNLFFKYKTKRNRFVPDQHKEIRVSLWDFVDYFRIKYLFFGNI